MCGPVLREGYGCIECSIPVPGVRCDLARFVDRVRAEKPALVVVVEAQHHTFVEHPPVVAGQLGRVGRFGQVEDEGVMAVLLADCVPPLAFPPFVVGELASHHPDPVPGNSRLHLAPDVVVERLTRLALLEWLAGQVGTQASRFHCAGVCGQRLQPEVRRRTRELIPGATVQENFGMAEGMLMFVRLDDPEDVRMETVGRPVSPDDEVRLVDDDDKEVVSGEVGELLARGPYTLRGYFGVPEYNARAFSSDGFYRSGDLMRRHPSGNYMVEGRKKDLINRGGEKISAEEIENLILAHPAVQNVACVPMPDALLGERMCACVILRRGHALTLNDLVSFLLKEEIAKHKLPERLEILDDFPLSPFGKVSKKDLTERVAQKPKDEGKLRSSL